MDSVHLIYAGYALVATSLCFFYLGKMKWALGFLLASAAACFVSATLWYPFLNVWDERFHALVAKNLMKHPLKPTLYDEMVVTMSYDYWISYHVWLHKQPGFLWQIMLSYFVFGVNEFALRFPSAVAFLTLTYATFRSGVLLVNAKVGYYSAFLFVSALYFSEMIAGRAQLDHHDVMSIAYAGLSIWAFLEYQKKKSTKWLILIGVFCGLAVLNKWLVGLIVFLVWGIFNVLRFKLKLGQYKPMFIALIVVLLIALPWQIFIYVTYPTEANAASGFFVKHFFEVLEGHSGSFWYHVKQLPEQFGKGALVLVIPAFIALGWQMKFSKLFFSILFSTGFVFTFFGLAATKMPSFALIISLPFFVAFGTLFYNVERILYFISAKKIIKPVIPILLFGVFLFRYDVRTIRWKHPLREISNPCYQNLDDNQQFYHSLNLPDNAVLFNVNGMHYIDAMFYTPSIAYNFTPSVQQLEEAFAKNKEVYIFKREEPFPEYILNNPEINVIDYITKVCE